jgi:aminopeptidase-like protein
MKTITTTGSQMYNLISELYPICRSITGNGVRETLKILQQHIPLDIHEVPTGTPVFDWTVPKEWNVRDAYVKNAKGEKVIDFKKSNLHILNYSIPIHEKMPLAQLKEHLFTLSDRPDWIPYRTSYYNENWGFCLTHRQLEALEDGEYEVYIDSSLEEGHLTYGEYFLKGETSDEILLSCHICHPSLCNDNLSGISLVTFLAKHLNTLSLRYSIHSWDDWIDYLA